MEKPCAALAQKILYTSIALVEEAIALDVNKTDKNVELVLETAGFISTHLKLLLEEVEKTPRT